MTGRVWRLLAAAVAASSVLTVSGLAAAEAAPAPARPATAAVKYCGPRQVTVIVDFTHFKHGRIRYGCARGPKTGLRALRDAGFSYAFVPRQPGFICTINRLPNPCNGAPARAYWSYWHARAHGKWRYSSLGAGSYHPKSGQVEGWAFGSGKPPHTAAP
jgi:hypothetical protein